jgi:hypothetical protein
MSTDFDLVCRPCKKFVHLGQRMAARWSFGYGTGDVEGAQPTGQFIDEHYNCGRPLEVVLTDLLPDGYSEFDPRTENSS